MPVQEDTPVKTRLTFRDPKLEALRAIPAFSSLPARRLDEIAPLLDELDIPAGRELMREGDRSREFLFIVDGSVFVTSGAVNPCNTIQAWALYVADQIKKNLENLFD